MSTRIAIDYPQVPVRANRVRARWCWCTAVPGGAGHCSVLRARGPRGSAL